MLSFLIVLAQLAGPAQLSAPALLKDSQLSVAADAGRTLEDEPNADEAQAKPQTPVIPPASRRRRGSMVGYIDDAIIASKVRVRFDAGLHDTVPDRAEFFYAKCGCYGGDAPGPRPGSAKDLNFQQLQVFGEYAVNDRFSAFAHVPIRWIQPQDFISQSLDGPGGTRLVPFSDQGGFADMRAGVKVGVVSSDDQSLTVQGQFYFPTGDAAKGLGTHHSSFEPALLYYQRVSPVVVLESQVGVWLPIGGASDPGGSGEDFSGNVFYYGIGSGFEIYKSGRVQFAPVVELVGWHVASGFQTIEGPGSTVDTQRADGTNIVNLKIGARITVDRGSFYVGYGHALTDATWYDDIVRFEYRFSF